MPDRHELAEELVLARSIEIATMPVEDHEPDGLSNSWALGVSGAVGKAIFTSDRAEKRDLVVLAGARILGWLEALDEPE